MSPAEMRQICDDVCSHHKLSEVATDTGVKLERAGREWKALCPFHDEKSPSFTVNDDKGFAHCFGCGWHGDVIDFIRRVHDVTVLDAIAMLDSGLLAAVERQESAAPRTPERDTVGQAEAIWRAAGPAAGTLVQTYLTGRGLTLPIPPTIRFARLHYGHRGPLHPVLVALITDVGGRPIGIERTYLAADGLRKAAVPKPKLSLGRITGGAIRLAAAGPTVVITEGLEDGLTLMAGLDLPVWVAAGCGNMLTMRFPAELGGLVIGSDNDPSGRAAAAKAAEHHASAGLTVRIMRPADGFKDFNDELRGMRSDG